MADEDESASQHVDSPRYKGPALQPAEIIREGWLVKRGHLRKNWLRRYFVCTPTTLLYLEQPPPLGWHLEKGRIDLVGAEIGHVDSSQHGREFEFSVRPAHQKRTYFICAETDRNRWEWTKLLKALAAEENYMPNQDEEALRKRELADEGVAGYRKSAAETKEKALQAMHRLESKEHQQHDQKGPNEESAGRDDGSRESVPPDGAAAAAAACSDAIDESECAEEECEEADSECEDENEMVEELSSTDDEQEVPPMDRRISIRLESFRGMAKELSLEELTVDHVLSPRSSGKHDHMGSHDDIKVFSFVSSREETVSADS